MTRPLIIILFSTLACCNDKEERILERWDNNKIKTKQVFYNDRDTGQYLILTYYSNGNIKERTHFINDSKSGWNVTYFKNGNVEDSTFYRDNTPVTTTRHFYYNGNTAFNGQFNEIGNRDGWWTFYDSLGRLKEKTEFVGNGSKNHSFYFDSLGWMIKEIKFQEGAINEINEEINYKDSLVHGLYTKYYETGVIAKTGEFLNGQRINTKWTDFYNTGQKHREYLFTGEYEWNVKLLNMWDKDGTQTVKDGKGKNVTYEYCSNGKTRTKIVAWYLDGDIIKTDKIRLSACR